jgi:pimeloyl-ACP methyl ester carboxylesterase
MRWIVLLAAYLFSQLNSFSQQKINFYSSDNIRLTADIYKSSPSNPFVILFHQEGASRGEFDEIAPKIRKLGYNCLAVDLRYGNKYGYIKNETREYIDSLGINTKPYEARKDILAAINFAFNQNHKQVILFGSSYSASLCLLAGKNNPQVRAVIGFSPGEFFGSQISVKDSLIGFVKPLFLASSSEEHTYITEMTKGITSVSKTIFSPSSGKGLHGASSLTKDCKNKDEYWLALLLFFRELED